MGRVGGACDPGMRVDLQSHKLETRISGQALSLGCIPGPVIPGSRDRAISPATVDKNSTRGGACRTVPWAGVLIAFAKVNSGGLLYVALGPQDTLTPAVNSLM